MRLVQFSNRGLVHQAAHARFGIENSGLKHPAQGTTKPAVQGHLEPLLAPIQNAFGQALVVSLLQNPLAFPLANFPRGRDARG
jgi:hypothetical protein